MLKNHLSKLLGERKMTQSTLAMLTGIRAGTISDMYNEMSISYKVEHLDKICEALECDITDLLEYMPSKVKKTGKYLIRDMSQKRRLNAD